MLELSNSLHGLFLASCVCYCNLWSLKADVTLYRCRIVWTLICIFFVISWPLSKLLDCLLGKEENKYLGCVTSFFSLLFVASVCQHLILLSSFYSKYLFLMLDLLITRFWFCGFLHIVEQRNKTQIQLF